MIVRGN
jgi:hypothetical protein